MTECWKKCPLIVMDYFSKWSEANALPHKEAATIAEVHVKPQLAIGRSLGTASATGAKQSMNLLVVLHYLDGM